MRISAWAVLAAVLVCSVAAMPECHPPSPQLWPCAAGDHLSRCRLQDVFSISWAMLVRTSSCMIPRSVRNTAGVQRRSWLVGLCSRPASLLLPHCR